MARLGKGLDALISKRVKDTITSRPVLIPINKIRPNPYQPRQDFDPKGLKELAESIKREGLLQPIIVRKKGDDYEVVVGARRLRAAEIAGIEEIPAMVRDVADQDLLVLALIENLKRKDLNPVEEAQGYQRLLTEFKLSQSDLAVIVGKNRATIANKLRLLSLPEQVKSYLIRGEITEGHARALLGLGPGYNLVKICQRIKQEGLSVRAVERMRRRPKQKKGLSPYYEIEELLSKKLGSRVTIIWHGRRGKMVIELYDEENLDRIIAVITGHGAD
jgi:ParB family chromosome partitioning protein